MTKKKYTFIDLFAGCGGPYGMNYTAKINIYGNCRKRYKRNF